MLLHLTGAVLTLTAGTLLGVRAAAGLRQRVRTLTAWEAALHVMETELSFRLSALPDLLERGAGAVREPVAGVLRRCRNALYRGEERPFALLWQAELAALPHLDAEERQVLEELGGILGRCAAAEQVQALQGARARLETCRQRARGELERQGRVRCVLGASLGLLLVLILF